MRRTDDAAAREHNKPKTRNGAQSLGVDTETRPLKAAKHAVATMPKAFSRAPNRASVCSSARRKQTVMGMIPNERASPEGSESVVRGQATSHAVCVP